MSDEFEANEEAPAEVEPVTPRSEADIVEKYFPTSFAGRQRVQDARDAADVDRDVEQWSEGYQDAVNEMYEDDDDEPELDLGSRTRAELQEAIDDGAVTDEQLTEFAREQIREDMQPMHEAMDHFAELKRQRQEQYDANYRQTMAEGQEAAWGIVRNTHRHMRVGSLNQERTLPAAVQYGNELMMQLAAEGFGPDEIIRAAPQIMDAATRRAADETSRLNMRLRLLGRRTDTGERER